MFILHQVYVWSQHFQQIHLPNLDLAGQKIPRFGFEYAEEERWRFSGTCQTAVLQQYIKENADQWRASLSQRFPGCASFD